MHSKLLKTYLSADLNIKVKIDLFDQIEYHGTVPNKQYRHSNPKHSSHSKRFENFKYKLTHNLRVVLFGHVHYIFYKCYFI